MVSCNFQRDINALKRAWLEMTAPPADSDEWDRLNNNGPNAQIDPVSFTLILPYSLLRMQRCKCTFRQYDITPNLLNYTPSTIQDLHFY